MVAIIGVTVLVAIVLAVMSTGFFVIQANERGVYFRFGRFVRILQPGLNIVTPLISDVKKIDVSPTSLELVMDDLLTADRARISVKATVRYRVDDPMKAFFETKDYRSEMKQSSITAIRLALGRLDHEMVWSDARGLAAGIKEEMASKAKRIGVAVDTVELSP